MSKQAKSLTLFGFFAITASMVMTVYEYPTFATSGFHLVFPTSWWIFMVFACSFMCSRNGDGGWLARRRYFSWVGNTLGERFGFAAIFFQWFQITVGFVTMIYFILGALSYVFDFPALESNPFIKFIGVLVIFGDLLFPN